MKARHWAAAAWVCLGTMVEAGAIVSVEDSALGCSLRLTGALEVGDAAMLEAHGLVGGRLCLDSEGGALAAAVALAEVVARAGLGTGIEAGARCIGSCGLVFLAGGQPRVADRLMHPDARLEIGLPALPATDDPQVEYAAALRSMSQYWQLRSAGTVLPDSIFSNLLATPPGEALGVRSLGQAARWQITVTDVAAPDGDVARALSKACGTTQASLRDKRAEDQAEAARLLDFGYADFGPEGAVARGRDCTVAMLLDGNTLRGRVETTAGTKPLSTALLHPPETRVAALPRATDGTAASFLSRLTEDARQALASVDFQSCWLLSPEARVVNVEDYVNLRADPGFGAQILRRVPLGEQLTIVGVQSLLTPGDAGQGRRCLDACNALALTPDDDALRGEVGGCIRSNVFWYEVRDGDRTEGYVSRKFLAP